MSSLIVEVCEIKNVFHHPNADRLDIAEVKGWHCIVGRNQYVVGDWVVFFPPDSVLPEYLVEKYDLEFLKKGGRVGTLKLRGYISQGLVLPVDCVGIKYNGYFTLGDDVKNVLGVTKYEVPERHVQTQGKSTSRKVQNPYFTKYTDIENIQNFDTVFQDGDMVVITEKIHGSNIRFGWLPIEINFKNGDWLGIIRSLWKKYVLGQTHEFVYGSHNVQLQWDNQDTFYGKNIYAKVIQDYDVACLPLDVIFDGEVYGKGVQELEYGRDDLDLIIFDIKSTTGYADYHTLVSVCQEHRLPIAPELYIGDYYEGLLREHTEGNSTISIGNQIREGCVIKSLHEENHPRIGRKILKSINPEYLARKNRTEYH